MAVRIRNAVDGSSTYQAIYRTVDGTQKSAGTYESKKEAEAAYMAARAQVLLGIDPSARAETVYPAVVADGETVSAFAERWLPQHELSSHSREVYEWVVAKYIVPRFGAQAVATCDTKAIAGWLRDLEAEGKKPPQMAKIKTVASALFQAASEDGLLPLNPVRGIRLKRHAKRRRKAFTHDQYAKLLVELDPHWHLLCDLITKTGVRWEEAQGLQKSDLEGNILWIGSVLNELTKPHRWEYLARTKTGKGREVKVPDSLVEQIGACPDGFLLLRPGRAHKGVCGQPYCLNEAHVRVDYFRKNVWHPALRAIGLAGSGLAPHDLRRTHATWLRDNGVPLEVVQQRLGHGSLTTTQIYLGEIRDAEDVALAAVNW